jgi:hypothetical protein
MARFSLPDLQITSDNAASRGTGDRSPGKCSGEMRWLDSGGQRRHSSDQIPKRFVGRPVLFCTMREFQKCGPIDLFRKFLVRLILFSADPKLLRYVLR